MTKLKSCVDPAKKKMNDARPVKVYGITIGVVVIYPSTSYGVINVQCDCHRWRVIECMTASLDFGQIKEMLYIYSSSQRLQRETRGCERGIATGYKPWYDRERNLQ